MPEFDPSQPFSVIDAAIAGSSLPANPSAIDLAVAPTVSTPAPAPEVAQVPEFDPTQPFTSVPAGPVQSAPAGPTFDPKAEFQKAFSIDDLKSKTVAELDAEKDFHPAEFNHQFEDALNADPIAKQKLLDVYKLRESTGRTTKDQLKEAAASPGKAVVGVGKSVGGAIGGLVSGAAKVFQNVSESGVGGAFRLLGAASVGGRAGQLGMNEEAKQIQGRQAELVAGVETAAVGTSDLLRRGVRTALEFAAATEGPDGFVQSLSGVKPTADLTNEEWAGRLLNDVASKKALSEATRGAGETMKEIGLRSEELKAAGIEIRPEVVEAMSPALDITNLLPLGAGAKVGVMTKAGGRYAVRELATATTKTQASKFIAAMNAGVEATPGVLGKGTAAVGKGIESAGVGAAKVTKFLGDAGNVAGVGALAYGSGGVGAGILAVTKAGPLALRATGRAIQAVAPAVAPAIRVGADIGAEFVKGYGQGLLFTAPFMIGADAEEREGLLGAAGLGGVARGGIRALGYGKHVARLAAEADQETLAGIIFKEVNQSTPPETKPYGTDPRLDADSARQIAKLDADPVRARAARVAHIEKAFDAETARMDVEDPLTPRQLEKRARLREEKLAKIPEVVKVQQNLLGWAKNLFKDSGVEFYAVDDAGMMRQTGGQSGRGFTVKTTTANGNPVVRVFLNGDVESLPHEMLHALGEIDAPGYTEFRNEVNATLTPDQKKSFEQIYNTVHNGGLPEAQWKNRLTPEQVSNEIAAELFSRTVLGEDLSGVAPSLTKRAALFTAGLLEKLGVPLGKLTKAQAKDFVPKGTKIKAGFSTLGLRPGVEAQALGQNFIRGLLKRAAEDAALPTGKAAGKGGTPPSPGGPGAAPITPGGTPPAPAPATPGATTPAVPPAVNPPSGPRNIRVTRERQDAFGIPEAQATAAALGNPDVLARVNEISEVIGTDTPALEILYKSVKDDGSPGDPTPRNPRRSAQEEERAAKAVGEIPENARELVQKIIVPVRWVTVGKGTLKSPFKPELIAMSLDKVAANVQMVVKEAQGKAGAEVPYGNKDGALTDAGWTDVIADLKTYAKNQRNGWKGDGGKLVRAEKSAGMDIPDETPGFTPTRIEDPNRANFLNMVQGFKLPFTNIRRSAEIPANLKGQKLAEINFRKVEPPVKAAIRKKDILKQTYPAQVTEPIFPGRGPMDIGEPNPMRNQFWDAGVDVGKLIEGVERINPEQVATVIPRPKIDYQAPVTDIIRGGFLPGPLPELSVEATLRLEPFRKAAEAEEKNSPEIRTARIRWARKYRQEYEKHRIEFGSPELPVTPTPHALQKVFPNWDPDKPFREIREPFAQQLKDIEADTKQKLARATSPEERARIVEAGKEQERQAGEAAWAKGQHAADWLSPEPLEVSLTSLWPIDMTGGHPGRVKGIEHFWLSPEGRLFDAARQIGGHGTDKPFVDAFLQPEGGPDATAKAIASGWISVEVNPAESSVSGGHIRIEDSGSRSPAQEKALKTLSDSQKLEVIGGQEKAVVPVAVPKAPEPFLTQKSLEAVDWHAVRSDVSNMDPAELQSRFGPFLDKYQVEDLIEALTLRPEKSPNSYSKVNQPVLQKLLKYGREQLLERGESPGQLLPGEAEGAGTRFIKRQNIDDLGRNILDSTQEKWQETTIEAGGLTGAAYKVGHRLEKAGDVAKLRAFEAEAKKQYDGAIAVQDFDAAMLAATKKQFFTEALETATGMKPGKRETIARYLGPDWKPPFPEEAAPKGQLLPKTDNPEAVKSAAIRNAETGDIFSGSTHGEAMRKADEKSGTPHSLSVAYTNPNYEQGFVTQGGEFLTREEARNRVEKLGQISPEHLSDASQYNNPKNLESVGFQHHRNFLPGEQTDAALRSGLLPDPKPVKNQPDSAIRELAGKLAIAAGVDYKPAEVYAPLDPGLSNRLADFYDTAKSDPKNPEVVTSYAALADETMKQYRALTAAGYKFEPFTGEGEPYKNSAEAVADIRDNKHLFVLSTALNFEGGNDNPMLLSSGVEGLPTVNDVFRGVHDVFGHAKEGYQFGPRGEFNAWRAHSEMYSPEAQGALAAETLAQNSWVNFGPHLRGDAEIPPSERPFAEQKAVVVPQELIDEARGQLLPGGEKFPDYIDPDFERTLGSYDREKIKNRGVTDFFLLARDGQVIPAPSGHQIAIEELAGESFQYIEEAYGWMKSRGMVRGQRSAAPGSGNDMILSHAPSGGLTAAQRKTMEEIAFKAGGRVNVNGKDIGLGPDVSEGQLLPKPKRDERGRPLTKDGLVDYEKLYKEKTAEEKRQAAAEAKTPSKYSTPTKASARGPKLTGWILPNRTFVPLDSSFHEQHLADNAENFNKQFGTAFSKTPNVEDRLVALNKGFVRIRGGLQGDRRTEGAGGVVIEMNEKFFPKARGTVESYLLDNAESIDNLTVNLLNDKGNVKDYQRVVVHELDGAERANALLSVLDDLRLRGPEGNFLPGGEETLPGLNLPSEERAKQLRVKSRVAKSRDKFPEALKLAYAKDDAGKFILGDDGKPKPRVSEYVFMDTPLAREAAKGLKGEDRVTAVAEALGKRLVIEGRDALKNPEMSAGTKWYSTARTRLKGLFGDDSKFFAELLGATSARTPVEVNYRFALDAYNQFKLGKFDGIIKKYREGKLRWLNADVKDFLKANPGNTDPTRGQFLDWWVIEHDLGPTQVNGKKYGANSRQVLRVLDGSWAAETGGPKTPNFAGNLSGSTFAATVDVWAARALHRLANEGNEKPWRILPEMETGVTDEDFAIGQAAYKFAADKLGMKPDALQAVLWFAEKDRWEREGWTRGAGAAKSDFNVLLKETEKVMPGGTFRMKNPQKELAIDVKPGDLRKR